MTAIPNWPGPEYPVRPAELASDSEVDCSIMGAPPQLLLWLSGRSGWDTAKLSASGKMPELIRGRDIPPASPDMAAGRTTDLYPTTLFSFQAKP